jgi:hypothetical protein
MRIRLIPSVILAWLVASGALAQEEWDVIATDTVLPGCRQLSCTDDLTCMRAFDTAGNLAQAIAITQNGGVSWTSVTVSQSVARPVGAFFFRSARIGWAVATPDPSDDLPAILRTVDGVTWLKPAMFDVPGNIAPPAQDGSSGIPALHMVSNSRGFAGGLTLDGGVARPFIAYTSDGGQNWVERTPDEIRVFSNASVQAIHFVDANVGLIALSGPGVNSGLYRTEDGGSTFTEVSFGSAQPPDPAVNPVIQFAFPSRNVGYALTANSDQPGGLSTTLDGGKTWSSRVLDFDSEGVALRVLASQMAFADTKNGFVVGSDSTTGPVILRTEDGGATFARDLLPSGWGSTTAPVTCAAALPSSVEYAGGFDDPRVLRRGMPFFDADGGVGSLDGGSEGSNGGVGPSVPGGGSGTPGAGGGGDGCSALTHPRAPTAALSLGFLALLCVQRRATRKPRERPHALS